MANIESLTPFEKGDNRASEAGKKSKRGRSWKTIYQDLLDCEPTEGMRVRIEDMGLGKVNDLTWQKSIAAAMMAKAMNGDVQAAKLITQTMEDQVGDIERPHTITVILKRV